MDSYWTLTFLFLEDLLKNKSIMQWMQWSGSCGSEITSKLCATFLQIFDFYLRYNTAKAVQRMLCLCRRVQEVRLNCASLPHRSKCKHRHIFWKVLGAICMVYFTSLSTVWLQELALFQPSIWLCFIWIYLKCAAFFLFKLHFPRQVDHSDPG